MKISELARRAGVSVPTVKHYLNQGLLPRPEKTGRTMAWYDESCVARVKLIKKLQREKFLPLEVIKRMLDAKGVFGEELRLGKAIFKTDKLAGEGAPVPPSRLMRLTGFAREKIKVLEDAGLICPDETDAGKVYRTADLRVIEMIKAREEMGVPFDHSVRIVKAYRDAIARAVSADLNLFATGLLGDVPAKQAARFMTEADESLDEFIVLYRHLFLRRAGEDALNRLNAIAGLLGIMNFLPPEEKLAGALAGSSFPPLQIINLALAGRVDESLARVKKIFPEPGPRPLDNAAAALAYVHSLGRASGFSEPMYLAKRALTYLQRLEAAPAGLDLGSLFARYVLGAVYVMLPDFFATVERGRAALESLAALLAAGKVKAGGLPPGLRRSFTEDTLPQAEVRVNFFLAEGAKRLGDARQARACYGRVIRLSGPSSPLSERARIERAGLGD